MSDLHDNQTLLYVTFFVELREVLSIHLTTTDYLRQRISLEFEELAKTSFIRIAVRTMETRFYLPVKNGGRHVELN